MRRKWCIGMVKSGISQTHYHMDMLLSPNFPRTFDLFLWPFSSSLFIERRSPVISIIIQEKELETHTIYMQFQERILTELLFLFSVVFFLLEYAFWFGCFYLVFLCSFFVAFFFYFLVASFFLEYAFCFCCFYLVFLVACFFSSFYFFFSSLSMCFVLLVLICFFFLL